MVLITEILEICIQTSYDQNVQLILKSYLPVVYGAHLKYGLYLIPIYLVKFVSDFPEIGGFFSGIPVTFTNKMYLLRFI